MMKLVNHSIFTLIFSSRSSTGSVLAEISTVCTVAVSIHCLVSKDIELNFSQSKTELSYLVPTSEQIIFNDVITNLNVMYT